LAKQLDKLSIRATAANEFVEKVMQVQFNAEAALRTAAESLANVGKSQEQLYMEAQEKQKAAELAAIERAKEAERIKNLQREMERAAAAKKEAEARAKKEAEEKAILAAARKEAEQAALNNAGME